MALNILIVDDSAIMRSMIIKTLKLSGVIFGEIHQACNGKEGLDLLDKHWIDIVFVDVNMPIMNGEEMLKKIREAENTKNLPVLIISTESSTTRIEILEKIGAKFIHKPFTPEILKKAIVSLIGEPNEPDGTENTTNSTQDF